MQLVAGKPRKAPGPDGIPAELGRMFPAETAALLFPLLLKFSLRGSEALGHKAGQAILFYKGRGSQSECAAYRAILLLCPAPQSAAVLPASSELQLSSKPGGSVVFGSQIVSAFHRW